MLSNITHFRYICLQLLLTLVLSLACVWAQSFEEEEEDEGNEMLAKRILENVGNSLI